MKIGKYLTVDEVVNDIYTVTNNHGQIIGEIEYYPRWRQFVFMPGGDVALSHDCMADISKCMAGLKKKGGERI